MAMTAQIFSADDDRAADRQRVDLDGTLRHDDDHRPVDVMIEDVSSTGFRMSCSERLPVNAVIWVGIAGLGRHQAKIVRSSGSEYGCRFVTPIVVGSLVNPAPQTIVTGHFGQPGIAAPVAPVAPAIDPPLSPLEQRIRLFRGPIIVAGLILPWLAIGGAAVALL